MRQRATYLLIAVFILGVEVLIATRLGHLRFVRASLGDVLVVALLYCLALAVRELDRVRLGAGVFCFACAVEASQYFHLVRVLGLRPGSVAYLALGDTFQWGDVLCYLVGCVLAVAVDTLVVALARRRASC